MNTTNGRSLHGCSGLLQIFRRISEYQKEVLLEWLANRKNDEWDHLLTEIDLEDPGWLRKVVVG
jgi:hypothetical protein